MARFLIFILVVLSVLGGAHFFFWARLVRDTQVPFPWRAWATATCVALAVSVPVGGILMRRLPLGLSRFLAFPIYTWVGVMFLLFILLLAGDLVRLILAGWWRVSGGQPMDPARRLLLARAIGGGAGAGAAALGALAVRQGRARPRVKELTVRLARLPAESAGLTIVQLTDLHVGPTLGRAFIEDVVAQTNALRPDLVAITGDLVDGSVEALRDAVAPLGGLRARHGTYFVTGNHEYFSGVEPWMQELGRLGMRVLRNERVAIGALDLAGIDDWGARRFAEGHGPDLGKALAGRDPARPVVLLAHQPRAVIEASEKGVALQLSGHTHAGQIWPWGYLVKLQQPYVDGLHRHGGTQIYVSPGTGYWGPPMRLGTRAEITKIVLQAEG